MKLNVLGANMTSVEHANRTVFFSYNTPVAVAIPGMGWFRTSKKFSVTTSKHINKFLGGANGLACPQSVIEALAEGVSTDDAVVGDQNGIREYAA